jgi:MFS family permease
MVSTERVSTERDFTSNRSCALVTIMDRYSGNTAVVCVAQFVVVLDATIVTTALPAVGESLALTQVGLSWVVTAYTLVVGALLVPCGRVADLLGPRRAFAAGMLVFAAASAACAVAWSPSVLIGARAAQGLGAALLSPAAFAMLTALTGDGPARRRAVGWWTAAAAGGGASGWVLGGVCTEYLGWRSVFWVNVPIAAVVLVVTAFGPRLGKPAAAVRVDVRGTVAVTAVLGLLVFGLTTVSWVPLVLAACGSVLLVGHLRRASDPVIPPWLWRTAGFTGAGLAALLLTAATTPAMYLSALYVQQVLRFPPAQASMLFPAFNLAVIAGSLTGPSMLRRLGGRRTLLAGFGAVAAGTLPLVTLPGSGTLVVAFAVMGAGLGAAAVASTHTGTEAVAIEDHGVAAGVLNAAAQVGTALGLAILAPLAAAGDADGYRIGFIGAGIVALVGLVTGLLVPDGRLMRTAR